MLKFISRPSHLLTFSFIALAPLAANANIRCAAVCEFFSAEVNYQGPGFVEKVDLQLNHRGRVFTELSKYRVEVRAEGGDTDTAYRNLVGQCLETAAANSFYHFRGTDYSPKVLEPMSLERPSSKEVVCTEAI